MNIIIFGAGMYGRKLLKWLRDNTDNNVICFLDNGNEKKDICGVRVFPTNRINEFDFDQIIISNKKTIQREAIKAQLLSMGVRENNIKILMEDEKLSSDVTRQTIGYDEDDPRIIWIHEYAEYVKEQNIEGSVAECGVYMGDCSHFINKYFSDRKLYLFDTFEGFDNRDLTAERELENEKFIKGSFNYEDNFRKGTTVDFLEILKSKLPFFDNCIIRKGYFPETAKNVDDRFVFVNLDMDLYQPQLAGLRFFYDRMVRGGIILLHDYFNQELPGVKEAVMEFSKERNLLPFFPIGDSSSVAVIKV